jgi:hypothetical protein
MGPVWLIGDWRNRHGAVTFPLASGGRSTGPGGRKFPYRGVTFAPPWLPQRYYHSTAVDPRLTPPRQPRLPPACRHIGGGWFITGDTAGAIKVRHIDVYCAAPANPGPPQPLHDAPADPSDPTA